MRRDFRKKQQNDKVIIYSVVGVLVLLAIAFALLMYGNSLDNETQQSQLSSDEIASIVKNETNTDSESASSSIGKTIEEQEEQQKDEEIKKNEITSQTNTLNITTTNSTGDIQKSTNTKASATTNTSKNVSKETNANVVKQESKKELSFQKPLEGEIMREFAKDNLIYSETLQEWVTHNGIDIKAEKATVVQAAEDGSIKSIKNDPRYGLTIVIEHDDGFQTIYANLLSSEFVTEGEKIEKGQSIGTVGNTAVFESTDEPHLHFEILKDMVQVDPNIYLK